MHYTADAGRFSVNNVNNSTDMVVVQYDGTDWQYNTNSAWVSFTPDATDRILASFDFGDDGAGVTTYASTDSIADWTSAVGFDGGDIGFAINTWNGGANDGEYSVTGTFYTYASAEVLLYSISGGSDAAAFSIDSNTGRLLEVLDESGISENTVGPKLQRARARLQSAIEKMGERDS